MPSNRRKLLRWGLLGLVVAVALVAWLASRGDDSEQGPHLLTVPELREAAKDLDHPLYWNGPAIGAEWNTSYGSSRATKVGRRFSTFPPG